MQLVDYVYGDNVVQFKGLIDRLRFCTSIIYFQDANSKTKSFSYGLKEIVVELMWPLAADFKLKIIDLNFSSFED